MKDEGMNEMARLHSAGAIVRHLSPFDELPSHKNKLALPDGLITHWVAPYYMEIGSYNTAWINEIKTIKGDITVEICLLLLGDFNWRTRLMGAYFAAVKGYANFIDIIGVHFLKSEVCCVGHIYALTLAFANSEKSVWYLNTYLDYYLLTPGLYFDQKHVMEAVLYLDNVSGTNNIDRHWENWVALLKDRKKIEEKSAIETIKMLEDSDGAGSVGRYDEILAKARSPFDIKTAVLSIQYFQRQVGILTELRE